jgi:hypothetical protein
MATAVRADGDPAENREFALSMLRRAKENFMAVGDRLGVARALSHEGRLLPGRLLGAPASNWYLANRCYDEALGIWREAGKAASALEEEILLAGTETELAAYRPDPALLDSAIQRLRIARETSLRFDRADLFAHATGELLFAYMQVVKRGNIADLDTAQRIAEEFRLWSREHHDARSHRYALLTRAGIYLNWCRRSDDLTQCKRLYRWILQATREFARIGDPTETATLRFNFAEMFERRGLRLKAQKLYEKLINDCAIDVQRGLTLTSRSQLSDVLYRASHRVALLEALDGKALSALATLERGLAAALPPELGNQSGLGTAAELATEYRILLATIELREGDVSSAVERSERLATLRLERSKGVEPKAVLSETDLTDEIRRILRAGEVLAVPLMGAGCGACVFVTLSGPHRLEVEISECQNLTDDALRDLIGSPGDSSGNGWLGSMALLSGELLGFTSQLTAATNTIDAGCKWLGEGLGRLLVTKKGSGQQSLLIIVAHGLLSMLPIHAARWTEQAREVRLVDYGPVSVIPSISVCGAMVPAQRLRERTKVSIVSDSCGDLKGAAAEAHCIVRQLDEQSCTLLQGSEAVFDRVRELILSSSHLHVAGHSDFHWYAPFLSSIRLSDRNMTVADVMALGFDETPSSVILSSCSSGMTSGILPGGASWGFPLAFHIAGVEEVIAALWPVQDFAMCLLYSEFYALYSAGHSLPEALHGAQQFLRVASYETLASRIEQIADTSDRKWMRDDLNAIAERYGVQSPMASPYFWAASICSVSVRPRPLD